MTLLAGQGARTGTADQARAQEHDLARYPVYAQGVPASPTACAPAFGHAGACIHQFATNAHDQCRCWRCAIQMPLGQRLRHRRACSDEARRQYPVFAGCASATAGRPAAWNCSPTWCGAYENSANTSFVSHFLDAATPVEEVVIDRAMRWRRTPERTVARLPTAVPVTAPRTNRATLDFGRTASSRPRALAAPALPLRLAGHRRGAAWAMPIPRSP